MTHKNKKILNCKTCNKEISVWKCLLNRKKFCSRKCYFESKKLLKGDKNNNWKGNNIGYMGIHKWLSRTFGKANECKQCGILGNYNKGKKWNIQ